MIYLFKSKYKYQSSFLVDERYLETFKNDGSQESLEDYEVIKIDLKSDGYYEIV